MFVGLLLDVCWIFVGFLLDVCWVFVGIHSTRPGLTLRILQLFTAIFEALEDLWTLWTVPSEAFNLPKKNSFNTVDSNIIHYSCIFIFIYIYIYIRIYIYIYIYYIHE